MEGLILGNHRKVVPCTVSNLRTGVGLEYYFILGVITSTWDHSRGRGTTTGEFSLTLECSGPTKFSHTVEEGGRENEDESGILHG